MRIGVPMRRFTGGHMRVEVLFQFWSSAKPLAGDDRIQGAALSC
jgi:hypothetical protein